MASGSLNIANPTTTSLDANYSFSGCTNVSVICSNGQRKSVGSGSGSGGVKFTGLSPNTTYYFDLWDDIYGRLAAASGKTSSPPPPPPPPPPPSQVVACRLLLKSYRNKFKLFLC